jgi:hypothetical protein
VSEHPSELLGTLAAAARALLTDQHERWMFERAEGGPMDNAVLTRSQMHPPQFTRLRFGTHKRQAFTLEPLSPGGRFRQGESVRQPQSPFSRERRLSPGQRHPLRGSACVSFGCHAVLSQIVNEWRMELVGSHARSVRLDPVAYEFPGNAQMDWIVVDGEAVIDEHHWGFRGATLGTTDLELVDSWLNNVAAKLVLPTGIDDDPSLIFIEPSLAFSVSSYGTETIGVRVHLTHEFAPPWFDIDEKLSTYTYFVELRMTAADIVAAASAWGTECAALLERGP